MVAAAVRCRKERFHRMRTAERRLSRSAQKRLMGLALMLPTALIAILIVAYPTYVIIQGSIHDEGILRLSYDSPLTLKNYQRFFRNWRFLQPLIATAIYTTAVTAFTFLIGLGSALLLHQRFVGRALARSLALLPWPIPMSIVALMTLLVIDPSVGILNLTLTKLGFFARPVSWVTSSSLSMIAVCLAAIWKGYPFFTITLLAGLQGIPVHLYEAAHIDGANAWQRLRHVTLPCLRPIIAVGLLLQVLWLIKDFTLILIVTNGGPNGATETLGLHVYRSAFEFFRMDYAAAAGVMVLLLAAVLAVLALRKTRI